mmetsp:Transcript_38777/g.119666  ORF Transcript_38777/g.119666 Transcript_38777/m.119666 type:complete len:230 (-) Transcript_38777:30-719(-)
MTMPPCLCSLLKYLRKRQSSHFHSEWTSMLTVTCPIGCPRPPACDRYRGSSRAPQPGAICSESMAYQLDLPTVLAARPHFIALKPTAARPSSGARKRQAAPSSAAAAGRFAPEAAKRAAAGRSGSAACALGVSHLARDPCLASSTRTLQRLPANLGGRLAPRTRTTSTRTVLNGPMWPEAMTSTRFVGFSCAFVRFFMSLARHMETAPATMARDATSIRPTGRGFGALP